MDQVDPNKVKIVEVSGCGARVVPGSSSWNNDGTKLDFNYTTQTGGTMTITVEADHARAMAEDEGENDDLDGNESPSPADGEAPNDSNFSWQVACPQQLAYQGYGLINSFSATVTPPSSEFLIGADGSGGQQIGQPNNGDITSPIGGLGDRGEQAVSWSKNGSGLAFFNDGCSLYERSPVPPCSLDVLDFTAKKVKMVRLVSSVVGDCINNLGAFDMAWSPDSSQIAYSADPYDCGGGPIQLVSTKKGASVGSVPNSTNATNPTWSATTGKIAFIGAEGAVTVETLVESPGQPVTAKNVVTLPAYQGISPDAISFSPNGAQLAVAGSVYTGGSPNPFTNYIYVENSNGTNPYLVWSGNNAINEYCGIGDEAWSPDGTTLACSYSAQPSDAACGGSLVLGIQEINVTATTGSLGALIDETTSEPGGALSNPGECTVAAHYDGDPAWRPLTALTSKGEALTGQMRLSRDHRFKQ